ncbi:MAG: PilZ domain-containing protein [Nitrospiraceae bacterium]
MVVRQHPRFPASFSGTLIHQSHLHQIDKSLDLSRKGCRLESPFRAYAGMKVDLLLYIPEDKTPILIQGAIVRWSGVHGIGIEFQSLASPHQERLDCTLRHLEARAGHS